MGLLIQSDNEKMNGLRIYPFPTYPITVDKTVRSGRNIYAVCIRKGGSCRVYRSDCPNTVLPRWHNRDFIRKALVKLGVISKEDALEDESWSQFRRNLHEAEILLDHDIPRIENSGVRINEVQKKKLQQMIDDAAELSKDELRRKYKLGPSAEKRQNKKKG